MRVISGVAKGRRLKAPAGPAVRPTADRVRQTIFDILGSVEGDRVLDLFSGSGALGIEALSRGAVEAVFVESGAAAVEAIKANLQVTGLGDAATVRRADVELYLGSPASEGFDLVFLDPPYERGLGFASKILTLLAAGDWVSKGGTVVVESGPGPIEIPSTFGEPRTRAFGQTQITMTNREGHGASSIGPVEEGG